MASPLALAAIDALVVALLAMMALGPLIHMGGGDFVEGDG